MASSSARPSIKMDSSTPPPVPDKNQTRRPGTAKSTRTLSNSSIPTLGTTRLARQSSTSSSNATPIHKSPLQPRRPPRSGVCPSSSRPALPHPALDPSQDHHRSDSGRSTGSSRSTATTDSFFLPQHPHAFSRRLKDLPPPPASSALADAPVSALGLNVSISPSAAPALVPTARLFRSQSSVSTTPTSPEEGSGSPLGGSPTADLAPLNHEKNIHTDGLDDFWQNDYSYAPLPTDQNPNSLPPLMRHDAPIPPSRSQSLDPLAEPLDTHYSVQDAHKASEDDLTLHQRSPTVGLGSATPLLAANLQKLNSQNDLSHSGTSAASKLASPVLSSPSGAPTPTRRSEDGHLATPSLFPLPAGSANSSGSAIDRPSLPNKSSSSLSASSGPEHDRRPLASASKRSSTSSSSSFRMTLSRQAKSFRNSFIWTPPANADTLTSSQDRAKVSSGFLSPDNSSAPISQASSPSLAVSSPASASSELPSKQPSPYSESPVVAEQQTPKPFPAISLSKSRVDTSRSSPSSADPRSLRHGSRTAGSGGSASTSAPLPNITPSPKRKVATDYGKLEERPRSRLSSRLTLQNANWSLKISNLTTKRPSDAVDLAASHVAAAAGSRSANKHSKSLTSVSTAPTAACVDTSGADVRDSEKRTSLGGSSKALPPLSTDPAPLMVRGDSSVDARLSPSFAETFAFLNNQIDSLDPSPPLMSIALPVVENAPAAAKVASQESQPAAVKREKRPSQERKVARKSATDKSAVATPSTVHVSPTGLSNSEDAAARSALFDRLADSPEAVYKTLVLPEPPPLPASKSLDTVTAAAKSPTRKQGHKKNISLGSATLISKSARRAASDLDRRASGAPVAFPGMTPAKTSASSRSSFAGGLPFFSPMSEDSRFFDALTSPPIEQPSSADASPSPEGSMLPTFATAAEFFPLTTTEPSSPVSSRPLAARSATATASADTTSPVQALPQPKRSSLGRRLSVVLDSAKARSARQQGLVSPPQSPRGESMRLDALPARPETSLGFHLRNPLRRERKESLKAAQPLAMTPSRPENPSAASSRSSASAIRKMSTGFRLDRPSPAKKNLVRAETSLGMAAPEVKTSRSISSRVLAPTKSSLARSVQPSPPSADRATVRSTSSSSSGIDTSKALSRSPQRPSNPPSSYRASPAAAPRSSVVADGSPGKTLTSSKTLVSATKRQGPAPSITTDQDSPMAPPPSPVDVRRRRTLSKPILDPIRTSFAEARNFARPSTATGFRGGNSAANRKMSQPTLDMVDDREFLEALEQVRAVQRERIQAEAQESENKSRLARLGMASGNHLKTKKLDQNDTADGPISSRIDSSLAAPATIIPARPRLHHRRSASADAQLVRTRSTTSTASRESDRDLDQRQKDIVKAYADKKPPVGPPMSGLEWGVGKASGKLHDGTFVNDDDWKKEVKALFLIRELVQTERSYARHLSSLLSVVRKAQIAPNGSSTNALGVKRKSASNLFAAYSAAVNSKTSATSAPPGHIALLRTYLPQLIALSNALVQRVEENPTSAGVGAAFDVLAAQLESTFVGWSGVASQALAELRSTELAKSKSPFKIGLIPLLPRESTEVGASTTDAVSSSTSGSTTPGSGFKGSALRMTSLTRPASPIASRQESNAQIDGSATQTSKRSPNKRRSTITSTSFIPAPRVVVAPTSALSASPEQEKAPEIGAAASTPTRRFGHSRSQSTLVTPLPTPTSSTAPAEPWSAAMHAQAGVKSLTPMDIAIMPTQRLPRYGLMLRDLLRNTPPESLSHARVQRAIDLIQKVALMCDAAAPIGIAVASSSTSGTNSGAVTPARAKSVMGMTSAEMAASAGLSMTRRS
ncbi:DH domain-containing protein [Pseudozyma hubeiensis]|nr:DH domain-containing protein [Pseudozyma hubeiensis]